MTYPILNSTSMENLHPELHNDVLAGISTIQYVHPNGDDSAPGGSWGSAKQTVLGAYDALPSTGGTIYIAHNSNIGGEVASQGIWIIGPNDPSYASPPTGWRQQKPVHFIGVGGDDSIQFGFPSAKIGGSGYDVVDKPVIWLAGTGIPIRFENLEAHYINGGIRLGISSSGNRECNTALVWFENVNFAAYNTGVTKSNPVPVVDVGYAFWVWFNHCTFHAYTPAAIDSDTRAAMMFKPAVGGDMPGMIEITDCIIAGGGIRYHAIGSSSWSLRVTNLVMEHDGVTAAPPAVRFLGASQNGQVSLDRVTGADSGPGSESTIVVADTLAGAHIVVIDGPSAIEGPVRIISKYSWENTLTPAEHGQSGFGPQQRLLGKHSAVVRSFPPVAVLYANLAPHDTSTWSGKNGSATVTTSVAAPDGTTGAATLTSTSGVKEKQVYRASRAVAAGDWFIVGSWIKGNGTSTVSTGDIELISATTNGLTFESGAGTVAVNLPWYGGSEWQWCVAAGKLASVTGTPQTIIMSLRCDDTRTRSYYAPMLLHIPNGTYSDAEVMEMMYHLAPYPDTATVGSTSTLRGQKLIAWGGLGVGNDAAASGPVGTVVKKIEVFDETGASLGYLPVYNAIT